MNKPRFKDDDGNWTYEGDTITFSYGIPPVRVKSRIMNRAGTLWVLPDNPRIEGCPLRSLRRYVGAWWKEEGGRMSNNKPPMTVWLETIDEDGCGMWFDDTTSPELAAAGPYVHMEQFMEKVERRAVKLFGKSFHNATMSECVSQSLKELAKEIMEGEV